MFPLSFSFLFLLLWLLFQAIPFSSPNSTQCKPYTHADNNECWIYLSSLLVILFSDIFVVIYIFFFLPIHLNCFIFISLFILSSTHFCDGLYKAGTRLQVWGANWGLNWLYHLVIKLANQSKIIINSSLSIHLSIALSLYIYIYIYMYSHVHTIT